MASPAYFDHEKLGVYHDSIEFAGWSRNCSTVLQREALLSISWTAPRRRFR